MQNTILVERKRFKQCQSKNKLFAFKLLPSCFYDQATIRGDVMRELGVIYNNNYYAISEHPGYSRDDIGDDDDVEDDYDDDDNQVNFLLYPPR